ncbi:protein kinase [Microbacterium sp. NPDC056569]|uniref:serine/threonine-protein kinase n=1 Tax=Microbacterium sp. NPDC056569 TaxID=3345867 RepID=UPI00366B7864
MSTPSALVADRYRLVKLLGAGGMGVVWQAWDTRLRRSVALKMLRTQPELTDAERHVATERAMREARITAGLHHLHAVTVFDVVEHDGQPCIVMQLIESTPLSELLREHGTFTAAEAARIGAQVASALAAAHELKIVHRDVKPGNILIGADGSALISDFGISHALGDTTITATGMIHGTPAYLAPEVARGLPTSFASDVFSLGSTLYAVVEGAPPFGTDKNAIALLHRVARGGYATPKHAGPLAPLLRKMLASHPKRRPTMASVADALASLSIPNSGPIADPGLVALGFGPDTADASVEVDAPGVPLTPRDPPLTRPIDASGVETEPLASTPPAIPAEPAQDDAPAPEVAKDTGPRTASLPTGETISVDQPARYEAPTAETEPLGRAASAGTVAAASATLPAWVTHEPPAEAPAGRPRRRREIVAAVLVVVVTVAVGVTLLLNSLRADPRQDAVPTPVETPTMSPAEETPVPRPAAPSPDPTPSRADPTPTATSVTPEQRVVAAISDYYAMMPGRREEAWPLMTADYQENHAGGRSGYESFWSTISDVAVTDAAATGPDSGQATLTYRFVGGRVVQEVTAYRFQDEGGVLKIAATEVLSSRQL